VRARQLVLLCCAAYSLPAQAIFSDGEARKQIVELRTELTRTGEALRQLVAEHGAKRGARRDLPRDRRGAAGAKRGSSAFRSASASAGTDG